MHGYVFPFLGVSSVIFSVNATVACNLCSAPASQPNTWIFNVKKICKKNKFQLEYSLGGFGFFLGLLFVVFLFVCLF